MNLKVYILNCLWCLTFLLSCNSPPDKLEEMVLIPAGEFQMGTNDAISERYDYSKDIAHMHAWMEDEQPVHTVYLDSYFMDRYPVTNRQYREFILANPEWQKGQINSEYYDVNYLSDWKGNNFPRGKGNHPVTSVSWYAAMAYAQWKGKRLPTEAEWERAARGGLKNKRFPWGDTIDKTKANYGKNIGKTTPVDEYPPNQYGLYDMSGNAMEKVLDEYNAHYYSISPRWNPVSGADTIDQIIDDYKNVGTQRVVRGGSWASHIPYVRVSDRNRTDPDSTGELGGFRCVKDASIERDEDRYPVQSFTICPFAGSKIKPSTKITIRFNAIPENLNVKQIASPFSENIVTVKNKRVVTIMGIFTPGELNLEITWKGGRTVLDYVVEAPIAEDMVLIPAGEFEFGHKQANNNPPNIVYTDAYYIDKYEVTVGEYKQFVSETGHRTPNWDYISKFSPTDKHPMILVNWYDAILYARWVGKRLPTEAEWEKAARGGLAGKKYPWGDTLPDGTQTNLSGIEDGFEFSAPVGSFIPNDYGLYDLLGNVGEWCLDSYKANADSNKKIADTTSNFYKIESGRGVRGGAWSYESYQLYGSYRSYIPSANKEDIGFRCVRPVKP